MSSDWDEVVLSDAIEIIGGGTPKTSVDEYWNGDIPWLSVVDFNDSGRFVFDTEKTITEYGLNNSSTKILDEGDIIISARGTVGALAQLGKPMAFNQSCYGIKGKQDQTVNDFLYYLLVNTVNNLKRIAHGGVFDTITRSTFDNITVRIPRIAKQIQIASILGSLDQKIHLNQETNETLEAMAQAIFKSWFVDFDPVRAKIEATSAGRDPNRAAMAAIAVISLKQDWDEIEAALDQKLARMSEAQQQQLSHTAELFPEELVESEIGEVPKGWEVKPFYDTIEIIGGGTPKTKVDKYWDGDILWYSVVDAPNESDVFVIETEKKITKTGLENSSAKLVDTGTTIISARGTVGKLALNPKPMTYNQSCYGLRSKNECPYFNFFKTKQLVESLKRGSHGSVFDTITQKTFKTIDIAQPPENLEIRFDDAVGEMMSKLQRNLEENRTLTQLRDTLLPKLISGEVGV